MVTTKSGGSIVRKSVTLALLAGQVGSYASIVMEPVCISEGMPEMRPAVVSKPMPAGSRLSFTCHTQPPSPPAQATDWEYDCWSAPLGSSVVMMVTGLIPDATRLSPDSAIAVWLAIVSMSAPRSLPSSPAFLYALPGVR